jgi:uncharacterized protein YhaN
VKIKDVQIDGFGVWAGMSVHSMPDGMTVFYGPNEAGKTTLMQFLRTMFYGFTTERRSRYLPPVHGGKPGGAIRVTGPGGGYEICRRPQMDQHGSAGALSVTGSDGLSQGPHRLSMLLGQIDETIFTNVFAIGLRELQELSTLDDTSAADELYKLSSGLDRVSLVEVIRQLRGAREQLVGLSANDGQLSRLVSEREKLKEEIERLSASARRWNELAALRGSQASELEELKERLEQWGLEAKTYELAQQVRPTWLKKFEVKKKMEGLNARLDLPDEIADRVAELDARIKEHEGKLASINRQRDDLRDQAKALPLRPGIVELAARIQAAAEQGPWIASLQKAQQRLSSQIDQAHQELIEDAARLGISEQDQQALIEDGKLNGVPDLSRQALNQLAEPASNVRSWTSRLKQATEQFESDQREAEKLEQELSSELKARNCNDIHQTLSSSSEAMSLLRKRIGIEEQLKKQLSRRKQLDEEAVNLQVDEAFSVERALLLGAIFVAGAFMVLWGLGYWIRIFGSTTPIDPNKGLMFFVIGMCALFLVYMMNMTMEKGNTAQLDDVEDQLAALGKEIQRTQIEREELDRRLPVHAGDPEHRLKELESSVQALESLLPRQQNLQAVQQRVAASRQRVAQATEALKAAKANWKRTLQHFGLSETMSPRSIRLLADGYDSLLQTHRRLASLHEELESRQLELGAITGRIDQLSRQVFAAKQALPSSERTEDDAISDLAEEDSDQLNRFRENKEIAQLRKADIEAGNRALEQLARLTELLDSQQELISRRRKMRERDQQLSKEAAGEERLIEKVSRSHHSVLAEHSCESEEHLLLLLDAKHEYLRMEKEVASFTDRIAEMISGVAPIQTILTLLEGNGAEDLAKRREVIGQRCQQASERMEQLHRRQGELGQEMKTLAADDRLSEAKLELSCIENQIQASAAHWQTLATTTHLLDRVCEVYETERQPETLREASAFLNQLTEGKYVRIWTPLGKNQLRIDNHAGQALPLEVLSRGTREAVFIALRLSLAASYARRGVVIPLVLDDVLVNFDSIRAESAAKVLRDFAALGHQVIMFTCHEHIMRIFHKIGVEVRVLPEQGTPGTAELYYPEIPANLNISVQEDEAEVEWETEDHPEEHTVVLEVEPVEDQPEVAEEIHASDDHLEEIAKPQTFQITPPALRKRKRPAEHRVVAVEQTPRIDWLWYEQDTQPSFTDFAASGWIESQERVEERLPPDDLWRNRDPRRRTNEVPGLVDQIN